MFAASFAFSENVIVSAFPCSCARSAPSVAEASTGPSFDAAVVTV